MPTRVRVLLAGASARRRAAIGRPDAIVLLVALATASAFESALFVTVRVIVAARAGPSSAMGRATAFGGDLALLVGIHGAKPARVLPCAARVICAALAVHLGCIA